MTPNFKLIVLASTPKDALAAQDAGVDRVFFDLEYIGKSERQRGRNSVQYHNDIEDLPAIRQVLTRAELMVRTNPIHVYTAAEVDKAISYGADTLVLPMVMDAEDVRKYVAMVNGRAKVCVMIETAAAFARCEEILSVPGVDEVFIGLNDLHLSFNLDFMFEPLSAGLVEILAEKCKKYNIPFGFGGIARIGQGMLPAEKILGEHLRLGSSSVILSRTFKGGDAAENIDFAAEVAKVRACYEQIQNWSAEDFAQNQTAIKQIVSQIIHH